MPPASAICARARLVSATNALRSSIPVAAGESNSMRVTREPQAGATEGTIYATDFRGHDRAVEIRFGSHAVRKVVPLDFAAEQGETIGFTIDPATAFLFDATSGARIETTGAAA